MRTSRQSREQILPTACGRVARGHDGNGQRPTDCKVGVGVGDAKIFRRVVWAVDAIADISGRRQGLEAVQKAWRDEQLLKFTVVQSKCLLPTESW